MQHDLGASQQEHRQADRLVQLIEEKLLEQFPERQADHVHANGSAERD